MFKIMFGIVVLLAASSSMAGERSKSCVDVRTNVEIFQEKIDQFGNVTLEYAGQVYTIYYFGRNFELAESVSQPLDIIEVSFSSGNENSGHVRIGKALSLRGHMGIHVEKEFICK